MFDDISFDDDLVKESKRKINQLSDLKYYGIVALFIVIGGVIFYKTSK